MAGEPRTAPRTHTHDPVKREDTEHRGQTWNRARESWAVGGKPYIHWFWEPLDECIEAAAAAERDALAERVRVLEAALPKDPWLLERDPDHDYGWQCYSCLTERDIVQQSPYTMSDTHEPGCAWLAALEGRDDGR